MIHLLNSITDATEAHRGGVAVSGSHGGRYPAAVASRRGLKAAIFNDAGVGLDEAGVAGVVALGEIGVPAATVDCMSARIGNAEEMLARGVVSMINVAAMAYRVTIGLEAAEAARRFEAAPDPEEMLPQPEEARREIEFGGLRIVLADSASLVTPEDAEAVIVTGSHGALIGGDPARALKAPTARLAVFNDAGMGLNRVGMARLPALDQRQVPAVTVSAASARIGEASSALETGVISAANLAASRLGLEEGLGLRDGIARMASA
ncbi:MAG: hypothetical protein AAFN79_00550 [Pseudomonadota bacterium]